MNALRILIIEDDAVIGMHLAELLEDMGHDVYAIEATESDAVIAASLSKPDLMIVDAMLQQGSGISAVEAICRSGHVPHIFISGDVLSIKTIIPSAVVVQKPFREQDIVRAIRSVIEDAAGS
ncbi:response regulator [Xanthobacter sp. DSM 24535]|uniref:response regulator n=1 Tax=Roseixanthobacter psychrophilus TaxID=3119917 RepID=UPI003729A279